MGIRSIIRSFINWAQYEDVTQESPLVKAPPRVRRGSIGGAPAHIDKDGMHFTVFNAVGGNVIQFSKYDSVRDRNQVELYIIPDGEDLGKEIAMIITKESLSR